MAGGGDVRIIGANKRVKDGVANVSENSLHVKVEGTGTGIVNSNLYLEGVPVQTGGTILPRAQRVPIQEYGINARPNFTSLILGSFDIPSSVIQDNTTAVSAGVNTGLGLGVAGALRTGPDKSGSTVEVLPATIIDQNNPIATSPNINVDELRFLVLHIVALVAGAPTSVRIVPEFSIDGGTTFFEWSVDQWVNFAITPAQMPFLKSVPLNYAIPRDFRVRAIGTGVTLADIFQVQIFADGIT